MFLVKKKFFFFERFVIRWGKFMSKSVFCLSKKRLFCEIWCIEILGLREFVRLVIVFLVKISVLLLMHSGHAIL